MCKLVFATTTQNVRSEYEHEQIQKRNKKVLTLAEKLEICVDPLAKLDDTTSQFLTDGVHYQDGGYQILGSAAAECICRQIG